MFSHHLVEDKESIDWVSLKKRKIVTLFFFYSCFSPATLFFFWLKCCQPSAQSSCFPRPPQRCQLYCNQLMTHLSHVAEQQTSRFLRRDRSHLLLETPRWWCIEKDWYDTGSLTGRKRVQVLCPKLGGGVGGWVIWVSPV